MNFIDLHVHSNFSDGTFTPTELVQYGLEKKLSAIALTDHDSMDGIFEAIEASKNTSIQVIKGIELSTAYKGKDIHILGLFVNPDDKVFAKKLSSFQEARNIRNKKMIQNFENAGFHISVDKMADSFGDSQLTRAHFARYLLNHNYVKSMREAFERYLNEDSPYYVPREKITPIQAVTLLLENKAIPVLAHPVLYRFTEHELETLIGELKETGLVGLEAIHSENTPTDEDNMKKIANRFDLLISGGSDFHGSNKPGLDLGTGRGNLSIPETILDDFTNYKMMHLS